MNNDIKVVAFDADDTLWVNETYFYEARIKFEELLSSFAPKKDVSRKLVETEYQNLPLYGYGVKPFTLSMIEAATAIADREISPRLINDVIAIGKNILNKEVDVFPEIKKVLEALKGDYRLVVATKGDLLDQRRKLEKSGLLKYFEHAEVMTDKKPADYQRLLNTLECRPDNFLMIGNSLKSDILPVLELGGYAIHIPFEITWEFEVVDNELIHENFTQIESIEEVLLWLEKKKKAA